jgi:hypothetical protein
VTTSQLEKSTLSISTSIISDQKRSRGAEEQRSRGAEEQRSRGAKYNTKPP